MYTVYVLKSINKSFRYIGMTNDLSRRLSEHEHGYSRTTRRYLPLELIYSEVYTTRIEARAREKYLKTGAGRELLDSIEREK